MSDTANLLDQEDETETELDIQDPKFDDLVGEGKRYKDPDILARSVVEKDRHISRVEAENRAMREELAAKVKMEDFMDRMNTITTRPAEKEDTKPQVTEGQDIDAVLDQKLKQFEARQQLQKNLDFVRTELERQMGKGYKQRLRAFAENLGLDDTFVNTMAAERPQAFLKMVGAVKEESLITPPTGSSRPQTSAGSGVRNKKYYDDLRKKDSTRYFSVGVQQQMWKDIDEMGESYFS
jgi:hypothetical protein